MKKLLSIILVWSLLLGGISVGTWAEAPAKTEAPTATEAPADTESPTAAEAPADAEALREQGLQYMNGDGAEQDFEKAASLFEQAAELGDAAAAFELALMYFEGQGVEADPAKAVEWAQRAADLGSTVAMYFLGLLYAYGEGVEKNTEEAVRHLENAAQAGSADAMYFLGEIYVYPDMGMKNDELAMEWFLKADSAGHTEAPYDIGIMYFNGEGVPQDDAKAAEWFKKAAELGNMDAMQKLSAMYLTGRGVAQDIMEGIRWMDRAAGKEPDEDRIVIVDGKVIAPSQEKADELAEEWYQKGLSLLEGYDESKYDAQGAYAYFEMAAAQGHAEAMWQLGRMTYNGEGFGDRAVKRDRDLALEWFIKAGEAGHVLSMRYAAKIYASDRNMEEAVKWYKKAADAGDQTALYELGEMYYWGFGGKRDHPLALSYLLKCGGIGDALYLTGRIYHEDMGVTRDDAKALEYLQKAVNAGDSESMAYLGRMYMEGNGVQQDIEKGEELFSKAGKYNVWAWMQLGVIYLGGHGVERDPEKSREMIRKGNRDLIYDGANSFEDVLAEAEAGDKSDMYRTGMRYLLGGDDGNTYPIDPEKAVYWMEKAATQGNWMSAFLLGYEYFAGRLVPQDLQKALDALPHYAEDAFIMLRQDIEKAMQEAAIRDPNTPEEWYLKGMALLGENGSSNWDPRGAYECFEMAAAQGHVEAMWELGSMNYYGRGMGDREVKEDRKLALEWFLKAGEAGHALSMLFAAEMYYIGQDIPQNMEEALKWYNKAADLGNQDALYALGGIYYWGSGVERDHSLALSYLQKCDGMLGALYMTGRIYHEDLGVTRDDAKALEYLQKAAEAKYYEAMCYLGRMYMEGNGVPQDIEKGEELFSKAGKYNDWAWMQLGVIYLGGHGVERDLEKSREMIRKGNPDFISCYGANSFEDVLAEAEAGDMSDMYRTGMRYLLGGDDGNTYPIDPEKAVYWLEKAAAQGNWMSAFLLGYEYFAGTLVPQDLQKALDALPHYAEEDAFIMLRQDIEKAMQQEGNK